MSMLENVWFWAPFHMLQAYPMTRNLPLPDVMIPFAHLIWVPFYIWEHWSGLCDPVEEAWDMKSYIVPMSGLILLSFFYYTHKLSDNPTIVKIGAVFYFAFMFFAKDVGFQGSPKKTYEEQIDANADLSWLHQHLFLHIYYLVVLWIVALTVPYEKLATRSEEKTNTSNSEGGLTASDPSNSSPIGQVPLFEVLKEVLVGEKLLPQFSSLSPTSKFLLLQGALYLFTGLFLFVAPGLFNVIMFFPRSFTVDETPLYRTLGFTLVAIGYYIMMGARMNHNYWSIVTIFSRIVMSPSCCMILWLVFGLSPNLAITFAILDPTLAYLTYLSLLKNEEKGQYTTLV